MAKENPLIYYIGKTKNFKSRITVHLKRKVKDKFHLFANLVAPWAVRLILFFHC